MVNGQPAVVYVHNDGVADPEIRYATGPTWTPETVYTAPVGGNVFGYPSVAEIGGDPACVFTSRPATFTPQSIIYATKSGTWSTTVVDATQSGPSFYSLREIAGKAAFSFYRVSPQNMMYAELDGTWAVERAAGTNAGDSNVGEDSSLFEYLGTPAIIYKGPNRNRDFFTHKVSGVWTAFSTPNDRGEAIRFGNNFNIGTNALAVNGVLPTSAVAACVSENEFTWLFEGCCC
jgi:hypothetical protein